jgi:surfeit locus 1 family protein
VVRSTLRLLFSRRWWWVTLLVLLGMAVMVRLSTWQLDRLQQRRAANEVLRQQLEAPPLSLNEVDSGSTDLATMADRQVTATGTFDYSEQVLLKVQNFRGSAGAHLVAPLRLAGGDQVVLVDRGWIPEAETDPASWSQFNEQGEVTLEGVIRKTETVRGVEPPEQPQQEWFRVDVEAIERQLPYDVLPVYVLQTPPPGGNQELPYREQPEIDLSEGPHLSYAIQWVAFAIMLGGGYLYFIQKQEEGDEGEAGGPPSPE